MSKDGMWVVNLGWFWSLILPYVVCLWFQSKPIHLKMLFLDACFLAVWDKMGYNLLGMNRRLCTMLTSLPMLVSMG